MRTMGDDFWQRHAKNPSPGTIRAYEKRAKKARRAYEKMRLGLAKWASKKKELQAEALGEYQAIVTRLGRPLEFDGQGRLVLEFGKIPAEFASQINKETVSINQKTYAKDGFLKLLPTLEGVNEAENEFLRVRSHLEPAKVDMLLKSATALWPYLEKDAGGRPTRQVDLFVFGSQSVYESWLKDAGMQKFAEASGFADSGRNTAVVCAEGFDDETVMGMAFHEIAHLFQYKVTPTVMPSWYSEGFAESWGGSGTFQWDGESLQAGGKMAGYRTESLKSDASYIPLAELVQGDALNLIMTDGAKALSFYAESWAFYHWLRNVADSKIQARFRDWEVRCKGKALGAEPGKPYGRNMQPATELFQQMFSGDLPAWEPQFREWVNGLD
jgi:hypothetical protein